MALWKIIPTADQADPRWLDHPVWQEVVVRARSAAYARRMAADMERQRVAPEPPTGNESLSFRSGFEDEKLYAVTRLDPEEEPDLVPDGPEQMLRATRPSASEGIVGGVP